MGVETKDLWQSAYVLSEGGWLERVRVQERNGKREVIFCLKGDGVEELSQAFISGRAVCNVARLKSSVLHLKEVIFGDRGERCRPTAGTRAD